jgi:putative methyltransferase (TIGR04325 family)
MSWQWYRGNYSTWEQARLACEGYDAASILERVRAATRLVCDGKAAYERDGIAFPKAWRSQHLQDALERVVTPPDGLRVLDFGGSLGSLYWQHRDCLERRGRVLWRVVEQPHFVDVGRREFASDGLSFWASLEEAMHGWSAHTLLVSGVLQYLSDPLGFLQSALAQGFPYVIIDRLPLLAGTARRLTIEFVPPDLGLASYPAWFLGEDLVLPLFASRYDLLTGWKTVLEDGVAEQYAIDGVMVHFRGFLLRQRHRTD